METKICPRCHTRLTLQASRCLVCGTLQETPEEMKQRKEQENAEKSRLREIRQRQRRADDLMRILAVLVALTIVIAFNIYRYQSCMEIFQNAFYCATR